MFFFFSSRRRHTRFKCDWSSDVCSSDLAISGILVVTARGPHTPLPETAAPGSHRPPYGEPYQRLASRVLPTTADHDGCHDRAMAFSVLVVDDDPTFVTLAARVLAEIGAEVVATAARPPQPP